jgi:hypothetical protein
MNAALSAPHPRCFWRAAGAVAADTDRPGHESPSLLSSAGMSEDKDSAAGAVGKVSATIALTARGLVSAAAISDT